HRLVNTSNTDTSKLTEVLAKARRPAPARTHRARREIPFTTVPCVTATPFGVPLDPDVYITYATSSDPTAQVSCSRSLPSPVSRSTWSMCTTWAPVGGSTATVWVSVRITHGSASPSMKSSRPLGYLGSTGT